MSKSQSIEFMKEIRRKKDEDNYDIDEYINELLLYYINKNGHLLLEDFIKYYYDLIKSDIDIVWKDLNNLG